jgi:hypothetical protein
MPDPFARPGGGARCAAWAAPQRRIGTGFEQSAAKSSVRSIETFLQRPHKFLRACIERHVTSFGSLCRCLLRQRLCDALDSIAGFRSPDSLSQDGERRTMLVSPSLPCCRVQKADTALSAFGSENRLSFFRITSKPPLAKSLSVWRSNLSDGDVAGVKRASFMSIKGCAFVQNKNLLRIRF